MSDSSDSSDPRYTSDECRLLKTLRDTPQIFEVIRAADGDGLQVQNRLRRQFPADLVRAALSVDSARKRAAGRLPNADRLWMAPRALEQATAWEVAEHKAARFPEHIEIHDLCCGMGVDAVALAHRGPVTAYDSDPAMCLRCEWNAGIHGTPHPVSTHCCDVTSLPLTGRLIHVDPDRRGTRDRPVRRLEQYAPPLDWLQQACLTAAGGALKLGPASNFLQKFPGCEIELVSLHGECREATVWFGDLGSASPFRATILPSGDTLAGDPLSAWTQPASEVGALLYDPDPAVVRSGLLDMLCERDGLQRLDAEDEYLTSDEVSSSPFVTGFRVLEVCSHNLRLLRRAVQKHPAVDYEVKCRRLHADASAIARSLPRGDGPPRVVIFARVCGKARIILAERLAVCSSPDNFN